MWPHPISICVGGTAISIGTDSPDIVAALEPWRILDVGGPTDYCLELDPPAPRSGKTRPLPGLYHGSLTLLRSRDAGRLISALLRVLGSHARPAGVGQIRIGLMPVVVDGMTLLAPPTVIGSVSDRWLMAQGIEALYTVSSIVDVEQNRVLIDPPLGSHDDPETRAFGGWWLPPSGSQEAPSPGLAVAEAMKLVTGIVAENAAAVLRAVATMVERSHPVVAPVAADAARELLAEVLPGAASR